MTRGGGHGFEHVLVALVVVTVCLSNLEHVLPHVTASLVILGVVVGALRLIFARTRGW
jgi:hypothetical protein